jgi:hypothetical protein
MLKRTDRRPLNAHIWAKDPLGFYVEPEWCPRRLFEVEPFVGNITDPACGIGRIADAGRAAGYDIIATDLVDRGYFTTSMPPKMLSHHCMICGKGLTDPASMARWIGPECAGTSTLQVPFLITADQAHGA